MKKLSDELVLFQDGASKDQNELARIAFRTAQVQQRFKEAVESIYHNQADLVLSHVNAVYITTEKQPFKRKTAAEALTRASENKQTESLTKSLIVYMDDSSFRSDIHNQQHFIILWLNSHYGEEIETFKTLPSRQGMRQKHPYAPASRVNPEPTYGTWYQKGESGGGYRGRSTDSQTVSQYQGVHTTYHREAPLKPEEVLTTDQLETWSQHSEKIENPKLRAAYRKAVLADQAWKKSSDQNQ